LKASIDFTAVTTVRFKHEDVPMTHREALSARSKPNPFDPNPKCTAELRYRHDMKIDGILWHVYWCPNCGVEIITLGATPHWANHVMAA
jgi:hypothetical protein